MRYKHPMKADQPIWSNDEWSKCVGRAQSCGMTGTVQLPHGVFFSRLILFLLGWNDDTEPMTSLSPLA